MNLDELLVALGQQGIKVWAEGDQLRLRAPKGALTAELREALTVRKPELLALLRKQSSADDADSIPLTPVARDGNLPLSSAQERLWFLSQMNPESAVYNLPNVFRLTGPLDPSALQRSIESIRQRHEVLRTTFRNVDGQLAQVVDDDATLPIEIVDLRDVSGDQRETEALRLAETDADRAFDLENGPLIRVTILQIGDDEHLLLLTLHHIISDGWSSMVFLSELQSFYEEFTGGPAAQLPDLPVQYGDYATWEQQWLQTDIVEAQLSYWKERLGGDVPVLELPADRARPAVVTYRGSCTTLNVSKQLLDSLKAMSQREGVTLFMTVIAAFKTLLHRYSGQSEVVVGSPIAHRNRGEIEQVIGCFINTLALRTDLSGDPSFRELLARVRETCREAYAHQDVPFEKLVGELTTQRDLSHSPLFQAMLILHVQDTRKVSKLGDVSFTPVDVHSPTSKFDVTLELTETADGLSGFLEYSTDLFDAGTIERLGTHLQALLAGIVAQPHVPISQLPLLTEAEREQLLVTWNATEFDYPRDRCMHQLFEQRADANPTAIAAVYEGAELTYRELDERANQLAHRLRELGVEPDSLVAICMERSLELLVGLLGIAKSGGAYVPLDPAYPKDRVAYILEDCSASVLVTQRSLEEALPAAELTRIYLDEPADLAGSSLERTAPTAGPTDLAYVIYTSGSTGKPKGVMLEHRTLVNFLVTMADRPGLDSSDVLLALTTISFDIAGLELYLPLIQGARVVISSTETAGDARALAELMDSCEATITQATPATWQMLLDSGWRGRPSMRVLCGGEALPPELARRLVATGSPLFNMYGPTETTIWSAVDRVGEAPPMIGQPIGNTQLYVLDPQLQLVPLGAPGELFIGGDGLARGYLGRDELTAEKFIPDPFRSTDGARLYRTGDLVRRRTDGAIEFLGRTDHQVKVRGFRIELGEIETVLVQHAGVHSAVVMAKDHGNGDTRLIAYLVHDATEEPTVTELRKFVRKQLPDYMVPSAFIALAAFPLTPNGKVDRRALLELEGPSGPAHDTHEAPQTPMEVFVADTWQSVLGIDRVGRNDNFFDLGGHSLLSMQVIVQLEKRIGQRINPREMFLQTLQQLAALCDERAGGSIDKLEQNGLHPPTTPQQQPPAATDRGARTTSLQPIYFGSSSNPLFGIYHPPESSSSHNAGVVLCHPFGREHIRAHRTFRQLAARLAREGFHALRFDLRGCGDSSGDSDSGNFADWLEDIRAAIEELRNYGNLREVSLLGLRLGASLAALAGARCTDLESVVLWEPIRDGKRYITELQQAHSDRLGAVVAGANAPGGPLEVLGFPITDSMRHDFETLDLTKIDKAPAERILILEHSGDTAGQSLRAEWQNRGINADYECVDASRVWSEGDGDALVPAEALRTIATWMTGVYA